MTHADAPDALAANVAFASITALLSAINAVYTLREHAPSVTIQDADANVWFPVERLVKTIAFRVKSRGYVLAQLCGYQQVDYKKLAAVIGVNRTQIMRLTPAEIATELGYRVGGVALLALSKQTDVRAEAQFELASIRCECLDEVKSSVRW